MARQTMTTVTCDVCGKDAPGALVVKVHNVHGSLGIIGFFDICGTCFRLTSLNLSETIREHDDEHDDL